MPLSAAQKSALQAQASTLSTRVNALVPDGGTPPPPPPTGTGALANLAANTLRDCGTYVNPHPDWATKGRFITDDSGMVADPARKQVLIFGGAHGPSQETDVRAFNTDTATWSSLYPSTLWADMLLPNLDQVKGRWINTNQPCARHTYNMLVIRGDRFYIMTVYINADYLPSGPPVPYYTIGRICWYDFVTKVWTYSNVASVPWYYANGAVCDPTSQNIYVTGCNSQAGVGNLCKYDPVADTVTVGPSSGIGTQPTEFVHCPADDKFYAFQRDGAVRRFTIDRANLNASTSTQLAVTGTLPTGAWPQGYANLSWHAGHARFGGCFIAGKYYEFDPVSLVWKSTTMQLEAGSTGLAEATHSCAAFEDSSGCYVFLHNATGLPPKTWVYRPPVGAL